MEELRSTEALDREILEDARKKAHRILKTADETLAAKAGEWEEKTRAELLSIKKVYAEREKKTGDEIFARLPLDKRRLRSQTAENLLVKAMDDFLRSLPRETLLSVLEGELALRLLDCADSRGPDGEAVVSYSGMTLAEARAVLEKAGGGPAAQGAALTFREDKRQSGFPSLEITTNAVKITSSVENAAGILLKDRRAELAGALLGEGVLND